MPRYATRRSLGTAASFSDTCEASACWFIRCFWMSGSTILPQDTHRHPFIHIGMLLSLMSIKLSATMRPSHLAQCMEPSFCSR